MKRSVEENLDNDLEAICRGKIYRHTAGRGEALTLEECQSSEEEIVISAHLAW
jgi:hypothetical protein